MRRFGTLFLWLALILSLSGCVERVVPGTEKTYCGEVVDLAMSRISEQDWCRESRAYIGIRCQDGSGALFWLPQGKSERRVSVGDRVKIESGIEEKTGLQIAVEVAVIK